MLCQRDAVDTGILQPCPLRDIPCGLLPPDGCPILQTIETDICKFWQCGVAQILKVATSEPFDSLGAILLGLTGLVLLGGAVGLMEMNISLIFCVILLPSFRLVRSSSSRPLEKRDNSEHGLNLFGFTARLQIQF